MKHLPLARALVAVLVLSWTFALTSENAAAVSCPCNLFGNGTPITADSGPDGIVRVGTAFTTDIDGYITGMRFYKGAGNTGTHVGELWAVSTNAFPLAQVTFTNETASGWQQATFPAPVSIQPGTQYIVAYSAPNGHYPFDPNFSAASTSGPLHVESPGGRFVYSPAPTDSPTNSSTANYWVDPEFTTSVPARSLFNMTTATPPDLKTGDAEVGTRFFSDLNTKVIGVRYWQHRPWLKSVQVALWKGDGTQLRVDDFMNRAEREGWFEVYFDNPVDITAGTEYVVSYSAENGTAGETAGFFSSAYNNGSLHAPVNAGVYTAGLNSPFPTTQTSDNFWVEPILALDASSLMSVPFSIDVNQVLSFTTASHNAACNGVTPSAGATSTSTGVSLGKLSPLTSAIGAQSLQVITNAAGGYTVFIRSSGPLSDGRGHTLANLGGGLTNASPGVFPSPGTAAFGYTTSDSALSVTGNGSDRFTSPSTRWAPLSTPAEVSFSPTGYVNRTFCVAYQATVGSTTPSGRYTTDITYTAVPIY